MPEDKPPFDLPRAHKMMAAICFNSAWDLIEKPNRTVADNELMILTSSASLYHWMHRDDCENVNLSIGHWQLSRVLALANRGEESWRHAMRAIEFAAGANAFFIGYAHEAAARAAKLLGKRDDFAHHLAEAKKNAASAEDEHRAELLKDIADLET
jgi:hypothetical protein